MGLYEVPLVCVLTGFWDRDYGSQLPCVRYYVLEILVWTETQRGPMCFRCLIVSLSGPCEYNVVSLYVLLLPSQWIKL